MTGTGRPERRAFAFELVAPGVIEGVIVPYRVPVSIGGVFRRSNAALRTPAFARTGGKPCRPRRRRDGAP